MSRRWIAAGCTTLVALALVLAPSPAGAVVTYHEYVALGDSWSADVFTTLPPATKFVPIDCAQSPTDYPHLVARALRITNFRDATCGSATSDHMTKPQTLPLGGVNAPQFNRLSQTTDLVTLGIGGNDIGIATAVEGCISLLPTGSQCAAKLTANGHDLLAAAIAATAPKIVATISGIRSRSPHARILLVNYLNGIPASGKGCWPIVPITNTDVAYLQAKFVQMNAMLARVAAQTRVTLVDTYTPTLGHDVCKPATVRYVEGLIPLSLRNHTLLAFPFHPNQAGANAQAQIVLTALR